MRIVVLGAGGIGGTIGARLHQGGYDVALVARGPHGEAIREHGLVFATPEERVTLAIPVYADPARGHLDCRTTWWCWPSRARTPRPPPAPSRRPPARRARRRGPERRRERAHARPLVRPRARAVRDDADRAPRARRGRRPTRRRRPGSSTSAASPTASTTSTRPWPPPCATPRCESRRAARHHALEVPQARSTTSATPSRRLCGARAGRRGRAVRARPARGRGRRPSSPAAGIDPVSEAEDDERRGDHLRAAAGRRRHPRRRVDVAEPGARVRRRDRLPQRRDRPARPAARRTDTGERADPDPDDPGCGTGPGPGPMTARRLVGSQLLTACRRGPAPPGSAAREGREELDGLAGPDEHVVGSARADRLVADEHRARLEHVREPGAGVQRHRPAYDVGQRQRARRPAARRSSTPAAARAEAQ